MGLGTRLEAMGGGGGVVSYPDPDSHSSGWITSPLLSRSGDVIHPQLCESGTRGGGGGGGGGGGVRPIWKQPYHALPRSFRIGPERPPPSCLAVDIPRRASQIRSD